MFEAALLNVHPTVDFISATFQSFNFVFDSICQYFPFRFILSKSKVDRLEDVQCFAVFVDDVFQVLDLIAFPLVFGLEIEDLVLLTD